MVLLRINGHGMDSFIDRDREAMMMCLLGESGRSSALHCQFRNGLCYGFAPGRRMEVEEMSDEGMMGRVARTMARLHNTDVPPEVRIPTCTYSFFGCYSIRVRFIRVLGTHLHGNIKHNNSIATYTYCA